MPAVFTNANSRTDWAVLSGLALAWSAFFFFLKAPLWVVAIGLLVLVYALQAWVRNLPSSPRRLRITAREIQLSGVLGAGRCPLEPSTRISEPLPGVFLLESPSAHPLVLRLKSYNDPAGLKDALRELLPVLESDEQVRASLLAPHPAPSGRRSKEELRARLDELNSRNSS